MNKQHYNSFQDGANNEIDLSKFLHYILIHYKMILLSSFIAFALSVASYLSSTKYYKVSSLLQVESFNQNSLDPTDTLQMMTPYRSSTDIDHLVKLYKSRTNILKIIGDLNLNAYIDISDEELVDIEFVDKNINALPYSEDFYILPTSNSIKVFSENGKDQLIEVDYGQEINIFDQFTFIVKSVNLEQNRLLKIKYTNPVSVYQKYNNLINVRSISSNNAFSTRAEGLIEISLLTPNITRGQKIIDYSNSVFINQRINAETEKSRAAIKFIDNNLIDLQKTVNRNKEKLKEFREKNQSINLDLETQAILEAIKSIDMSLNEIDIELSYASEIYTLNNPVYINLVDKKNIYIEQKNKILSKIKFMPKEQQVYIDLFNQVEITQSLLEELETRRLGFSILEASTIGDIRIIDKAYMETKVAPKLTNVLIITFLAFFVSLSAAIIRGIYFLPLTNPAEIMDNGIFEPILGVIPFEENVKTVDFNNDSSRYKSAMESAIINIRSLHEEINNEATIISLTSPTALNGKSTTAAKLSEMLSLLGKKILLVDADFKRGSLGKDFNVKSISEKTFFRINSSNLDDYIISDNLYLIPRIKGLINSFHFICNPQYSKIFQELKKDFDYIIFDTAPLLSVADTSVILELSDLNLLVLRHNFSKIKEAKQALDMFSQINVPLNGFIYNAYEKDSGYYGMYANYAYAYYANKYINDSYEYNKED